MPHNEPHLFIDSPIPSRWTGAPQVALLGVDMSVPQSLLSYGRNCRVKAAMPPAAIAFANAANASFPIFT